VERADGGTLFLDELPEFPLTVQAKLLRLLQNGTCRRVGDSRVRRVRMRIIAAMNKDPDRLVSSGRLKADLLFRLLGHRIDLPPLRNRPEEISAFALEFAVRVGLAGISAPALEQLVRYHWPGNVRQLEMLIRVAASTIGPGATLDPETVSTLLRRQVGNGSSVPPSTLRLERIEAERQALIRTLEMNGWNVTATARALSISRQALHKALKRTGLGSGGISVTSSMGGMQSTNAQSDVSRAGEGEERVRR
jgi:transcriptional regulator with GAF, ATPase, and Fis domain